MRLKKPISKRAKLFILKEHDEAFVKKSKDNGITATTTTRKPCYLYCLAQAQRAFVFIILAVFVFIAYPRLTRVPIPEQEQKFYLNDATLRYDPDIHRHWLQYHDAAATTSSSSSSSWRRRKKKVQKPKLRLVLTDFGWNHPNPQHGLTYFRSKRSRELVEAFVNHPSFDPSYHWKNSDMEDVDNKNVQTIVLMDLETCFIENYPSYTHGGSQANADLQEGRAYKSQEDCVCWFWSRCSSYVKHVLDSPLFQSATATTTSTTTLLFLDCSGDFRWADRFPATLRQRSDDQTSSSQQQQQLSFVSMSVTWQQLRNDTDMGMPPPPIHPIVLTKEEETKIETCQAETSRYFYLSFIGSGNREPYDHGVRQGLFDLNNKSDDNILLMPTRDFDNQFGGLQTFDTVVRDSLFSATPRGDCLFSYRFAEVLSAGAIPVLHADGWVLPFRNELVDWSECIVIIPEVQVHQTLDILQSISQEQQCQMRKRCYEIYQTYMATGKGTMKGIVDSVVAMKNAAH